MRDVLDRRIRGRRTVTRRAAAVGCAIVSGLVFAAPAMGVGDPALVRDIRPGPEDSGGSWLAAFDGRLYLSADDGTHGAELWSSDGTEAGTDLLVDIYPGPEPSFPIGMTDAFGELIFRASDGAHGAEPWASDGTGAGTAMAADIAPGAASSSPEGLTLADGRTFFQADDGTAGHELWLYEGAPAAPTLLKSVNPAPGISGVHGGTMVVVGDSVYFGGDDGTGLKLWKSDGTASGTVPVSDDVFVTMTPLVAHDGKLLFSGLTVGAGTELWVSDGTDAGTEMVEDIWPGADGSLPMDMVDLGGTALFFASDESHGRELWRTDGTAEGTELVEDLNPGALPSIVPGGAYPVAVGDTAYFAAGDSAHGRELWRSDGTSGGTELVEDIRPGPPSSFPAYLAPIDGDIFFLADDGAHGYELWLTDGGTDADMVADIVPGAGGSVPSSFTQVGADLFFVAGTPAAGRELWSLPLDDPPVAVDDSGSVAQDAAATAVDVLANDTDVDGGPKSIASVTQPAHGEAVVTGGGTGLTYRPDPGYCDDGAPPDTFAYALSPGGDTATVAMTVACADDPQPPREEPPPRRDPPPPDNPPTVPVPDDPVGTAIAKRVATVRGGVARLSVSCPGKAACSGLATLAVKVRRGKRTVRVALGSKRFAIRAGRTKTLRIALNRAGRSRIATARAGGLRVELGGNGVKSRTVVLKPAER